MIPVEICIQGGIVAYGYGDLFKIQSVIVVTALVDAKTKQRDPEEEKRKKKGNSFGKVFEEECDKQKQREIPAYCTTGYTKDAKKLVCEMRQKEYV